MHLLHELCRLVLAAGLCGRDVLLQQVQQWLVDLVVACSQAPWLTPVRRHGGSGEVNKSDACRQAARTWRSQNQAGPVRIVAHVLDSST